MSITINGSGVVSGLASASIQNAQLGTGVVAQNNLAGNVAGNGPAFSAYISSQTVSSQTWTKIACTQKEFDTNNNFDNTTNYRFQPTIAGYYQFNAKFHVASSATQMTLAFYKNGSFFKSGTDTASNMSGISSSALIYLNGSTDYVELYGYAFTGQALNPSSTYTYFQGFLVRAT
jgi:C1q domain